MDPDSHPFFDPKTGKPNVWYSPGESGALEFFNGPGFHPRTGKALTEITQEFAEKRLLDIARAKQERADAIAREKQKQADDLERTKQKQADDLERTKQKQADDLDVEPQQVVLG